MPVADLLQAVRPLSVHDCNYFTFILGPGNVRYLTPQDFVEANEVELIDHLRSLSGAPKVVPPSEIRWNELTRDKNSHSYEKLSFDLIDDLFRAQPWDRTLSIYHQMAMSLAVDGIPSRVYYCFHRQLELDTLALSECAEAWIKEYLNQREIIESYRQSSDHLIVRGYRRTTYGDTPYRTLDEFVFMRTPFVARRLCEIEAKAAAAVKEAARAKSERLNDEAQRATNLELERLRKSRFDSYVYLMEDSRNGMFKIGRSKTPGKRERTLQSEVPGVCLRIAVPADEEHEQWLHKHFSGKSVRGEWFSLSPDDVVWIVAYLRSKGDISRATVDFHWLGQTFFGATQ
jgi:T5orf172 domain